MSRRIWVARGLECDQTGFNAALLRTLEITAGPTLGTGCQQRGGLRVSLTHVRSQLLEPSPWAGSQPAAHPCAQGHGAGQKGLPAPSVASSAPRRALTSSCHCRAEPAGSWPVTDTLDVVFSAPASLTACRGAEGPKLQPVLGLRAVAGPW